MLSKRKRTSLAISMWYVSTNCRRYQSTVGRSPCGVFAPVETLFNPPHLWNRQTPPRYSWRTFRPTPVTTHWSDKVKPKPSSKADCLRQTFVVLLSRENTEPDRDPILLSLCLTIRWAKTLVGRWPRINLETVSLATDSWLLFLRKVGLGQTSSESQSSRQIDIAQPVGVLSLEGDSQQYDFSGY